MQSFLKSDDELQLGSKINILKTQKISKVCGLNISILCSFFIYFKIYEILILSFGVTLGSGIFIFYTKSEQEFLLQNLKIEEYYFFEHTTQKLLKKY